VRFCGAVAAHRCRRTTLPHRARPPVRLGCRGGPRTAHTAHAGPARFCPRIPVPLVIGEKASAQ
jgi:hypothetical protein